ncbi:MAG: GNAT family N-acetyltransferase [Candidatus Syntrophosphaera sp.]|nr:GNAT family N-acetyltransferase [Candidatus Syntrophosphaera sp.]
MSDRQDLIRIAKGIWGGTDYLPKVMDIWISEPWFLVCEYRGRVIGCLKMTSFPDHVLWFEGLRVQVRYQNHGIATLLNRHSFAIAARLKRDDPALSFEFCTYYQNSESLHLTQKLGFRVVHKFYVLNKRGIKATLEPRILEDIDLGLFHHYPDYIPCAWQTVHNSLASLPFLKERGCLFQSPRATYYLGGLHERYIILLEPPNLNIKADLPYFQHFFGSRKSYQIIIPPEFRASWQILHLAGFRVWADEVEENMLVLRM